MRAQAEVVGLLDAVTGATSHVLRVAIRRDTALNREGCNLLQLIVKAL